MRSAPDPHRTAPPPTVLPTPPPDGSRWPVGSSPRGPVDDRQGGPRWTRIPLLGWLPCNDPYPTRVAGSAVYTSTNAADDQDDEQPSLFRRVAGGIGLLLVGASAGAVMFAVGAGLYWWLV